MDVLHTKKQEKLLKGEITMAYILGVDIGTSGTKTVLFSEDGTPVSSATYEYPLYTPQNG